MAGLDDRALWRRHHGILPALRGVIDAVRVPVRLAGDGDCGRGGRQRGDGSADRKAGAEPEAGVVAAPVSRV